MLLYGDLLPQNVLLGLEEPDALLDWEFAAANLFECTPESLAALGHVDKMLIDPPREGALEVVKALGEEGGPRRIVYVSCNPPTLARDAAVLVSLKGYRFTAAGVVNMFPHTGHVESIAVFDKA